MAASRALMHRDGDFGPGTQCDLRDDFICSPVLRHLWCLKQMDHLRGGFTGPDGSVERWLSTLFQPSPNQPTAIIEQPGNLQFVSGESTPQEAADRNTKYSFDKIRQAFFLSKMCRTVPEKESLVKALVDNFLVNAYASWVLPAPDRANFLRTQAKLFETNSAISESIGTLPFCSIDDAGTNEIFEVASLRSQRIELEQQIAQLNQAVASQQQLLTVAAEDKRILSQALETARSAAQAAIDSVRDTELKRYRQLQAATDVLIAEKNAELLQALQDERRNLAAFQNDRDTQVKQLQDVIQQLSSDLETKLRDARLLASKDLELAERKCESKLAARDQEFNIALTGKLNALDTAHKNELSKAATEVSAKDNELRAATKALDDLRKEFAMLATQAGAMRQHIANVEEGIELREREILTLRNQLEDGRTTNASKVRSLESQVVDLNMQLASKHKQFQTELSALKSQAEAACATDVARLAQQSDERIASIQSASEARLAQQARANTAQQMALRKQFEALQDNQGSGCTIV